MTQTGPLSKWVAVLVAGFMTCALLLLALVPVIYKEPFRAVHLVFWALFVGSAWWLERTIRTPAEAPEAEPAEAEEQVVSPAKTSLILLGVLAIIPWAFLWVAVLSPLFGLQGLPVKGHLIFVIGIPPLAVWLFVKIKSLL